MKSIVPKIKVNSSVPSDRWADWYVLIAEIMIFFGN